MRAREGRPPSQSPDPPSPKLNPAAPIPPPPPACAGFWLAYGLLVGNWFIAGPNVAGAVLNVLQLATIAYVNVRVARDPSLTVRRKGSDDGEGRDAEAGGAADRYAMLEHAE